MTRFWCVLNVTLALMGLAFGLHALDWLLADGPDAQDRIASFQLSVLVHVSAGLGAMVIALSAESLGRLRRGGLVTSLAGTGLFCAPLYLYGVVGWAGGMIATVPGLVLLLGGWIALALSFLPRRGSKVDQQ